MARARLLARARRQAILNLQRAAPFFRRTFSAHSGRSCHSTSAGGVVTAQCWTDERLRRHSAPPVCRRRRRWTPNCRDHYAVGPRGKSRFDVTAFPARFGGPDGVDRSPPYRGRRSVATLFWGPTVDTAARVDRVVCPLLPPCLPPNQNPVGRRGSWAHQRVPRPYLGCPPSVRTTLSTSAGAAPPPTCLTLIRHVERPLHAGSSRGGGAGRAAPGTGVAQGSPARPYPFLPSIAAHARVAPSTAGARLQRSGLVAARGTADGSTISRRSPSPPHPPPLLPPYQELVREASPRARLAAQPPATATPSAS